MSIDPRAVVGKEVELGKDVEIGPFAIIEGCVRIGDGTRVYPNAFVSGWVEIGKRCEIHPNAVLGHLPQDFHFEPGTRSFLRIGDGTIIRESAQVHRGTQPDSATVLGKECFILCGAHVGHNCTLGNRVKVYTNAILAGHVEIGDDAIVSGLCALHQFIRIGRMAMIGGGTVAIMDVPPYMTAARDRGCCRINTIGMKRAGHSPEAVRACRDAYRLLYRSEKPFGKALDKLAAQAVCDEVREIVEFCQAPSQRGIMGRRQRDAQTSDTESKEIAPIGDDV